MKTTLYRGFALLFLSTLLFSCSKEKSQSEDQLITKSTNPYENFGVIHNDYLDILQPDLNDFTTTAEFLNASYELYQTTHAGAPIIDFADYPNQLSDFDNAMSNPNQLQRLGDYISTIHSAGEVTDGVASDLNAINDAMMGVTLNLEASPESQDQAVADYFSEIAANLNDLEVTLVNKTYANSDERAMVLTTIAIARYSLEYWTGVYYDPTHPYYSDLSNMDVSLKTARPWWKQALCVLATVGVDAGAGAAGSLIGPGVGAACAAGGSGAMIKIFWP